MRKTSTKISLLFIPLAVACGGKNSENKEETTTSNEKELSEEVATSNLQFEDVPTLAGKTVFTTDEFFRTTSFLNEKEAILIGYPYAYPADEEVDFVPNTSVMTDAADNSGATIEVKIKFKDETDPRKMKKGEPFAVKGKLDVGYSVSESWGNAVYITLYDAEFMTVVEGNNAVLNTVGDIDLQLPMNCGDLNRVLNDHYSKLYATPSVEITGPYNNTVTSTTSDGVTYNVTLGTNEAPVHCYVIEEPDNDALNEKRNAGEQVTITGKFSGSSYTPSINQGVIK